jgi:SpoVK/Ycf46/Vps4 family AAA+-type ATPase
MGAAKRDPKKISNYNKFLSTLDRQQTSPPCIQNTLILDKDAIDKLITSINENFSMQPCSFLSPSSLSCFGRDFFDPNEYTEVQLVQPKPRRRLKKNMAQEEIKEIIQINVEIKSIADILQLIDTYKVDDPTIRYNINMQAMHQIRKPLEALQQMVGMKSLKDNIVDQILYFAQGLHKNKDSSGEFLHTVIYGPPGTGKTEIAKIMGAIYSHIGILSKGSFKKVTRSDLVAGYLGQTALKTKDTIKEALGGVLFLDEAYSLGDTEKRDSFAKECIDTLCECASDYKDDLMIIVAGYEKELRERFFQCNQGLDSRFTWRFKTDEYSYSDLHQIFLKKVSDIGWTTNGEIGPEWFKKHKDHFRFYGRDIESLLSKTKIAHSRRVFCLLESDKKRLTVEDLDKGLEIYKANDDSKHKQDQEEFKRYMYSTLYT